jgi:BON domain
VTERAPEPKQYLIARVQDALAQDSRVNALDIDVTVAGGKVFLTGNVPTQERKDAISIVLAERVPTLLVQNEITVSPVLDTEEVETLT